MFRAPFLLACACASLLCCQPSGGIPMCLPPPDAPMPWRSHVEADWVVGRAVVHARAEAVVEQARLHALRLTTAFVEARIREQERTDDVVLADVVPNEALPRELRDTRIDINTASASELETLPRIGPAMSARIIAGRPYGTPEDLMRVSGIGPSTLERLAPLVRASAAIGPLDGRPDIPAVDELEGSGEALP